MMRTLQFIQAILHIDQYMGALIAQYGAVFYLVLCLIVFCEIGLVPLFFLPGDPLLFVCGAFSASGALNIWILLVTLFLAAVSGGMVNYWIGSIIGQKVFTHDYRWLNRAALAKTHLFYEKHGGATLIVSPYLPVVRTFAPFIAGISEMTFSKFQLFNVIGAAVWIGGLVVGGNLFGNIPLIRDHLSVIVLTSVVSGLGAVLLGAGWRIYRTWTVK
jgi:membrane-associated protein